MKSISYSARAVMQLRRLQPPARARIEKSMRRYADTQYGDVKKLQGRSGLRLRVGDWRIIFVEDDNVVLIVAVGHRRDIYD